MKHEKFVFRTDRRFEEIASLMHTLKISHLNFEFQCVPLGWVPADAWAKSGHRIRALEFYDCQWTEKALRDIITCCTNLMSFVVIENMVECGERWDYSLNELADHYIFTELPVNLLNGLVEQGIQRTQLHTFGVFCDDLDLGEGIIWRISLIYTRIRRFTFGLAARDKHPRWLCSLLAEEEDEPVAPLNILMTECLNLIKQPLTYYGPDYSLDCIAWLDTLAKLDERLWFVLEQLYSSLNL